MSDANKYISVKRGVIIQLIFVKPGVKRSIYVKSDAIQFIFVKPGVMRYISVKSDAIKYISVKSYAVR